VKIEGVLRDYMNVMMAQQKGGYWLFDDIM